MFLSHNNLISIVIPTFNRASFLGATLDSILGQSHTNWECLVVDDGSNDYSFELLEFYCQNDNRIQFFRRPMDHKKGANSCRNFGFRLSKGAYINWFDSDDIMHPDFLKKKIENLSMSGAYCSICKFKTFNIKQSEMVFINNSKVGSKNIIENIIIGKYAVPTHAPLWKKEYLDTIELFDENLSISQDLDFHLRALPFDGDIDITDQFLFYIRKGHDNITSELYSNTFKHFDSFFYVRKKILNRYFSNGVIRIYISNELMGMFRYLLVRKDYRNSLKVLTFLKRIQKPFNLGNYIKFLKIYFLYYAIRIVGKGETKLKRYLYLNL